ncbi:MAG: D-glycero-beta-D-manno-heptose-7-phosphate kinase [Deltaproteobacteria bacterium]|nr:D-glycero-beta-D-manno-heptose-7-phosphate kinase [Deltaproteobacteria bacterium]
MIGADHVARWLRSFAKVRVLVLGDLILDQFIWGRVERISPEAPVPVVQVTDECFRLGGAANVVHNVRVLGGQAAVLGVVGADAAGRRLLQLLRAIGAKVDGAVTSRGVGTTRKTRIVAHQQQVVRLDRDQPSQRTAAAAARLARALPRQVAAADVVVVSDYGKGVVTPALLAQLAALRQRRGFVLVIDPKKQNYAHYRGATLLTPNTAEASQAAGVEITDAASLQRAGALLLERWQAEAILITRGEHGMALFQRGGPARHFPTVARHVFDVTGAGDTVVATAALALGAGAALEEAAVLANHAAGIVVGEVGTATVSLAALRAALRRGAA